MRECPRCKRCYDDQVANCPDDDTPTAETIAGGSVLDGRYQLERRLGQGGMGVVYKSRHIFLKTQHAIKIILPDLVGNDPNLVTRFRQEALAAAAIRHRNIIAVTDFGVVNGTMPYLVMELVQGESLQDLIAEQGAIGPARAFEIMQPICLGIAAAHRQNLVHRDLKPLNVMIQDGLATAEGVKILDFGLTKIKSGELLGSFVAAQTTGSMASPFYMAPEQWSDEPPDARVDVYSLGVMLYQMLAGEVPFKGNTIPSIMKKHLTEEVPTFASKGVQVTPEIEAVVRHALEKEPDLRTRSAEQFIEEFSKAVAASGQVSRIMRAPPHKTTTPAPPATETCIGPSTSHSDLIGETSWMDEQEKLNAAREELAREEARSRKPPPPVAGSKALDVFWDKRIPAATKTTRPSPLFPVTAEEAERKQKEEARREEARLAEEKRLKEERHRLEEQRAGEAMAQVADFCLNCGSPFGETSKFCSECGKELPLSNRGWAERLLADTAERRRAEEQRVEEERHREEERRMEEERRRVEELVAQQTKAIEEKLTQLAATIPPTSAVADPEATHIRPVGATTVTENSYPTLSISVESAPKSARPFVGVFSGLRDWWRSRRRRAAPPAATPTPRPKPKVINTEQQDFSSNINQTSINEIPINGRRVIITKPITVDNVRCSVFAPLSAKQGHQFLVQVFPHLFGQETKVRELAREFDKAARRGGVRTFVEPVARGSKLTFQLMMPGLIVEEPVQSLIWQALSEPEPVQFSVSVPADHPTETIVGKVTVSLNTVPIGHIHFSLTIVAAACELNLPSHVSKQWIPYKRAFISYASPDRKEVLKRVQMLELAGIKYFQDLLSLEPGQRWERALYREIDNSDVFFLFWSTAAKRSEWVMKEVQYAIKRKNNDDFAPPAIVPVIIEGPPPVAPPPELAHLHFNHHIIYFMV